MAQIFTDIGKLYHQRQGENSVGKTVVTQLQEMS